MIQIQGEMIRVSSPDGRVREIEMGSPEGFRLLSRLWLRSGWDTKYVYSFSWLGRPIIQLPEDMIRFQEVVYQVKPDVIVEIGIAHGGSLVFSAGLCRLIGKGRVIGIDIEIRPHNRRAIEEHPLSPLITMIEGDSIEPQIVKDVRARINDEEVVMVSLDGCHERDHVLSELEAYSPLISTGSYIIAMDGIMKDLVGAPRSQSDWAINNPQQAAFDFVLRNKNFVIEPPPIPFNEGAVDHRVTYWPNAFIKRVE